MVGYSTHNATPAGDKEVEAGIPVNIMGPGPGAFQGKISTVFTLGDKWFHADLSDAFATPLRKSP